jgi:hypothetical protein
MLCEGAIRAVALPMGDPFVQEKSVEGGKWRRKVGAWELAWTAPHGE